MLLPCFRKISRLPAFDLATNVLLHERGPGLSGKPLLSRAAGSGMAGYLAAFGEMVAPNSWTRAYGVPAPIYPLSESTVLPSTRTLCLIELIRLPLRMDNVVALVPPGHGPPCRFAIAVETFVRYHFIVSERAPEQQRPRTCPYARQTPSDLPRHRCTAAQQGP